jgi:signal recognition particle subunit SRP72
MLNLYSRPSDASVAAAASNNIVTINKDQNIFDSKKKIKAASASELEFKLNSGQRKHIAYNEILLCINSNQVIKAHLYFFISQIKEKSIFLFLL